VDEPTAANDAAIRARRARIKRWFNVGVVVVAAVAAWYSYWDGREPSGLEAFVGFGLALFVLAPLGLLALVRVVTRLFEKMPIRRPLLVLACAIAPWIAGILGVDAAQRDFEQRRRPVYEKVIAAIRCEVVVDDERNGAKRASWQRDLSSEELATFRYVRLERDDAGKLSVWFHWAGRGPPPMHLAYVWFESGRPDEETLRHWSFGSLGDGWYTGND
jgi:hypothetical protein